MGGCVVAAASEALSLCDQKFGCRGSKFRVMGEGLACLLQADWVQDWRTEEEASFAIKTLFIHVSVTAYHATCMVPLFQKLPSALWR
jgi:hypothetical protein